MMETLYGIAAFAVLFALFGLVKHRGCTGHCDGCSSACGRHEGGDHDVR